MLVCFYAGILAVSVTYAAVSGALDIRGSAHTSADLSAIINKVETPILPTLYGSKVVKALINNTDELSMDVEVELNAPGDMVYITFNFENTGILPMEFEDPEITISGVDVPVLNNEGIPTGEMTTVYPIIIEDYVADGVMGFEDIDGYILEGKASIKPVSDMFGMAFIWDEDVLVETKELGTPITFNIKFPYVIADITDLPSLNPSPSPAP